MTDVLNSPVIFVPGCYCYRCQQYESAICSMRHRVWGCNKSGGEVEQKQIWGKKKFVVACRCAEKLRGLVTWQAVILSFTERSLSLRLGGCCASRCVRPVCYASAFLWNCRRRRVCDSEEATACWDEQCDALSLSPPCVCVQHRPYF